MEFQTLPSNIAFFAGALTENIFTGVPVPVNDLTQITAGTCNFYARILPSINQYDLTYENFRDFSLNSQNGVITDVKSNPLFKTYIPHQNLTNRTKS